MKNKIAAIFYFFSILAFTFTSCVKDAVQTTNPRPPLANNSINEGFEDVSSLSQKGWVIFNNSDPIGPTGWRQGKYEGGGTFGGVVYGFPAYSAERSPNDFVSCDAGAGNDVSVLSAWLITPKMTMKNGDQIIFYTKAISTISERLQVRANFINGTTNVGNTSQSVGDFTNLLLDINPGLAVNTYPTSWTKYTITFTGLQSPLLEGRIAFRYYVPNGGPLGDYSNMIGIDSFQFLSK